jgi:hypothetical protein
VELGGVNQAESGGPFLWNSHPRTVTPSFDIGDQAVQTWTAEHDGYMRLRTPTRHRRSTELNSATRKLTVVDTFDTATAVELRLSWHLGPQLAVELDENRATLSWQVGTDRRQGKILLPDGLTWTTYRAATDPVEGWYAPRFGVRLPATSLVGRGMAASWTRLVTELELP